MSSRPVVLTRRNGSMALVVSAKAMAFGILPFQSLHDPADGQRHDQQRDTEQ